MSSYSHSGTILRSIKFAQDLREIKCFINQIHFNLSNFSQNFPTASKLSNFSETFQLQKKLSNFGRLFPTSKVNWLVGEFLPHPANFGRLFPTLLSSFQLQSVFPTSVGSFQLRSVLSNFAWLFPPISAKPSNFRLFNLKLSNFSFFPTALSSYTYPFVTSEIISPAYSAVYRSIVMIPDSIPSLGCTCPQSKESDNKSRIGEK